MLDECIYKQALLNKFADVVAPSNNSDFQSPPTWNDAVDIVDIFPPSDVRPVVRGHWELAEDGWYCTACKRYPPFDCDPEEKGVPFCPWCGADMSEETIVEVEG